MNGADFGFIAYGPNTNISSSTSLLTSPDIGRAEVPTDFISRPSSSGSPDDTCNNHDHQTSSSSSISTFSIHNISCFHVFCCFGGDANDGVVESFSVGYSDGQWDPDAPAPGGASHGVLLKTTTNTSGTFSGMLTHTRILPTNTAKNHF